MLTQTTQTNVLGVSVGIQTGPTCVHVMPQEPMQVTEPRSYQARLRRECVEEVIDHLTIGMRPDLITREKFETFIEILDGFSDLSGLVPPSLISTYEADSTSVTNANCMDITSYRLSEQGVQMFLVGGHYFMAHQTNET